MDILYPFHPRIVHFPIALVLSGVVLLALGGFRREQRWREAGQISLMLGWLGALAAALTGLIDQSRAPQTQAVVDTINLHITTSVALIVALGLVLYLPLTWRKRPPQATQRALYAVLIVSAVALVLTTAYLGGRLVFTLGVGVAP